MKLTEEDKELLALKGKMESRRCRDTLMGVARMMVLTQDVVKADYGLLPGSVPARGDPVVGRGKPGEKTA